MKAKLLITIGVTILLAASVGLTRYAESNRITSSTTSVDQALPAPAGVSDDNRRTDDLFAAVENLRNEIHRLNADLASLSRNVAELQMRTQGHAAINSDEMASREDLKAALTEANNQRQQLIDDTATAFGQERVDTEWSAATTARLHDVLGHDTSAGDLIRAVECRSTTCRVELLDDGSGKFNAVFAMATIKLADVLPNALVQPADRTVGTPTSVVYLSRANAPPEDNTRDTE